MRTWVQIVPPAVLAALLLAVPSLSHAVYKCVDEKGKVTYSDKPCSANEAQIERHIPSSGNQGDATPEVNWLEAAEIYKGMNNQRAKFVPRPQDPGYKSGGKCSFSYYAIGDEKGQQLAAAAKAECLKNDALQRNGRANEVSNEAYNRWKDHRVITKRTPPVHCTTLGSYTNCSDGSTHTNFNR